jgi:hypothetical protein
MPDAEHGDVVYELTRSDWTRLVKLARPKIVGLDHVS